MESPSIDSRPQRTIIFNDVTLRDGEQAPGNTMNEEQKLAVARQLVQTGIPAIEAGFPVASPGDFRAVERIASEVGTIELPHSSPHSRFPRISGLAHLNREAIAAVLKAVRAAPHRGVHTFISTSQEHLVKFEEKMRQKGRNPASMRDFLDTLVLPGIEENFRFIRETDPEAVIQFSLEDWTRTDDEVSDEVITAAAKNGAHIINLPDTIGIGIPREIGRRVAHVRQMLDRLDFGPIMISWHGHNDSGQGVACAMEALYGGAEQFETTILGLGERAGNFSFEGMLAALDSNWEAHERITGVRLTDTLVREETMRSAQLVADIVGIKISREHPLVGENFFAHEAGIHQQGVIAGRKAGKNNVYGKLVASRYGAKEKLILGKHSGWAGIKDFLETNGLPFRESDRKLFTARLSEAGDQRPKGFSDEEVLHQVYYPVVQEITGDPFVVSVTPEKRKKGQPLTVKVQTCDGKVIIGKASGMEEGVIDAFVQGMKGTIPGLNIPAGGLSLTNPADGSGGKARVTATMHNEHTAHRTVEDTDSDAALLQAHIDAFNTLYAIERYQELIRSKA